MTTSNITVSPLTPAIGAEIGNVDLGQVTDQEIIDIRAALLKHKVVFFREQTLSQAQHIGLARGFGELEIHPATPSSQSNPEVLHIAHGPESKGQENFWHSDVTWREKPSLGSILKAVKVPAVGGGHPVRQYGSGLRTFTRKHERGDNRASCYSRYCSGLC